MMLSLYASSSTASATCAARRRTARSASSSLRCRASASSPPATTTTTTTPTREEIKMRLLRLSALTDRGQLLFQQAAYAPLDEYNRDHRDEILEAVDALVKTRTPNAFISADRPGCPVEDVNLLNGEWECVLATKQLFRSSPFFMAIQDAFGDNMFGDKKSSEVFFRLHELQVKSWGASTVGRVAQKVDVAGGAGGTMESYFDTILFALTVIPILGWFKLLPTFGGRIISFAEKVNVDASTGEVSLELVKTRVEECRGIPRPWPVLLPNLLLDRDYPVGAVWRLLPWNKGRAPTASTFVRYVDEDFRIMADRDGEVFVYCRVK